VTRPSVGCATRPGVGGFDGGGEIHVISSLVTPQVRKAEELTGLKRDQIPSRSSTFMRCVSGRWMFYPHSEGSLLGGGCCSSE
jgi:hypothetical protein